MASPVRLRFVADSASGAADARQPARGGSLRIDYAPEAFPPGGPAASLTSLFPQVRFQPLARAWSGGLGGADLVIAAADALDRMEVDDLCASLADGGGGERVIVFLDRPDVETTRRLIRSGAADVLPAPITEPALAASLERLLARMERGAGDQHPSQVIALLKAGGGVGATALGAQLSAILAERESRVCLVDLDVQSGAAAMYLDLQNAVALDDVLAAGKGIGDVGFAAALATHFSGAKVLAAPRHFMALDAISADDVDALLAALRRAFDIILVDLPSAWTNWTEHAVRQADQIALITQLSVPHAHLVRRQLQVLRSHDLEQIPLKLVCNRTGGDAPAGVSVRSVERAIGRAFDAVLPEDTRLMGEAINQGLALRMLKRGSKLEKALAQLAQQLCPQEAQAARPSLWRR